jgi:hypothetical protein
MHVGAFPDLACLFFGAKKETLEARDRRWAWANLANEQNSTNERPGACSAVKRTVECSLGPQPQTHGKKHEMRLLLIISTVSTLEQGAQGSRGQNASGKFRNALELAGRRAPAQYRLRFGRTPFDRPVSSYMLTGHEICRPGRQTGQY